MKKLIVSLCVVCLMFSVLQPLAEARNSKSAPTVVPMRNIANELGGRVDYNGKTVTFTFPGGITVRMEVGSRAVHKNGVLLSNPLPLAVTGNPGTAFIPLRYLAELVGFEVGLNPGGREYIVTKQKSPAEPKQPAALFTSLGSPLLKFNPNQIDLAVPGIVAGYGRDLLAQPGVHADDFLLVVKRGEFNTGGFSLVVEQVQISGNTVKVFAKGTNPAPGATVSMAKTYPYQVIRINAALPQSVLYELYINGERVEKRTTFRSYGRVALQYQPEPISPILYVGQTGHMLQNQQGLSADALAVAVYLGRTPSNLGVRVTGVDYTSGNLKVYVESISTSTSYIVGQNYYPYEVIYVPGLESLESWEIISGGVPLARNSLGGTVRTVQAPATLDVSPWAGLTTAGIARKVITDAGVEKLAVAVKRGQCPTSGYDIVIESVSEGKGGQVEILVRYTNPVAGAVVNPVITQPYKAIFMDTQYFGREFVITHVVQEQRFTLVNQAVRDGVNLNLFVPGIVPAMGRDLLVTPGIHENNLMLVVKRGECRSGGYGIAVEKVILTEGKLKVMAKSIDPAPGDMVTWALTYPYQIVAVSSDMARVTSYELYLDGQLVPAAKTK